MLCKLASPWIFAFVFLTASRATETLAQGSAQESNLTRQRAIAALQKLGGSVRPISRINRELRVEFYLNSQRLTDNGLTHVSKLPDVALLNLRGTKITGAGLQHLQRLKNLKELHLERTKVTDDGTASLARLENLEYLNLYATTITDKTLEHLSGLKKLKQLYVWQTRVTDAGVARLAKKLPKLEIVRGIDLSKLPTSPKTPKPEPKVELKWTKAAKVADAPKSAGGGTNTAVIFENQSARKVKVYWVDFAGQLKQYATLAPDATHRQNSYAKHTWLITTEKDLPLGYFIVADKLSTAVIPKTKK